MMSIFGKTGFILFFLLSTTFIACGGGGGGSNGGPEPEPAVNMQGTWRGKTTIDGNNTNHTMYLDQNGNNLTGTLESFPANSPSFTWPDINGTINGDMVSDLSAIVRNQEDVAQSVELEFDGIVSENIFSGDCKLYYNNQVRDNCTFSFNKINDNLPKPDNPVVPDNPVDEQKCLSDYSSCTFNCGTSATCGLSCAQSYQSCLAGSPSDPDPIDDDRQHCINNCATEHQFCVNECDFNIDPQSCRNSCYNEYLTCNNKCY